MIELPDFTKSYEYENNFYFSCANQRIGKLIAHYELFKIAQQVKGDIVECGVFKGASLIRFAMYRKLFEENSSRKIIGFDSFGEFPDTDFEPDKKMREDFIKGSGAEGIETGQLISILESKECSDNVELVKGDINKTIPEYAGKNPDIEIALLNLDVDVYEPSVTVLEYFYPRLVKGGVLILDDYKVFPGETKAVDDYFSDMNITLKNFPYTSTPYYLIKE